MLMKFSAFAFLAAAFSTSSKILDTAESPNVFSVFTLRTPERLMHPEITESPADTSRGIDSPVNADVSSSDVPSITTPSSGILSPALMRIVEPTGTSFGDTVTNPSPFRMFAVSGAMLMRSAID